MTLDFDSTFLGQIVDGLEGLDAELEPGGLYASDPNRVFTKVLFPLLKNQGFGIEFCKERYAYLSPKTGGDGAYVRLEMVSKIKVRLFGSHYVLDRHVRHDARWDQKNMERLVSKLWSESHREKTGLVLLVGYDSNAQALASEFRKLEQAIGWETHGVRSHGKVWPDPHGRGFFTCARLWSR